MHSIERLESRIAPALLAPTVVKGVLMLQHDTPSGTGENLVVTQVDADSFTVTDTLPAVDTNFGQFDGVKSIAATFGGDGSKLDVVVSTDGLAGTLNINAAGGTNEFTLRTVNFTSGRIVGKVTIEGGTGADTVRVDDGIAISSPVLFDGHTGVDHFLPNETHLAKLLTLESVEDITTQSYEPVVIGGMLVENEDADAAVVFVLNNVATIAGKLTYCGSDTVDDNVTLNGQVTGAALLMLFAGTNNVTTAGQFASSLKITGDGGADTVVFNTATLNPSPPAPPAVDPGPFVTANVTGALTMKLGDGTNAVTMKDSAFFGKGFALTTGAGADTMNFDKFIAMKNVTLKLGNGANTLNGTTDFGEFNYITGAFKYTGGVDADTLDLDHLIAGTITVNLGNGLNDVTGSLRVTGKSATFTGGTGKDTLNFDLASVAAKLTVKLNADDDSFTFGGGALGSVVLDGGAGANDTFTGMLLLPAVQKISNFETQT